MMKNKGLIVYSLDYGELSLEVGRKLRKNPPKNFVVVRYDGQLPSEEIHDGFIDGVIEGKEEQWLNWGHIYDFFREADSWVFKQLEEHKAKLGVSLHSISHLGWEPPEKVDLDVHSRYYNKRFTDALTTCVEKLPPSNEVGYIDVGGKIPGPIGPYDLASIVMSHSPEFQDSTGFDSLALTVRNFCECLTKCSGAKKVE